VTSLMFGTLSSTGVPADEEVVRSTATPVEMDAPAAMQEDMPEQQEVETDPNPHLGMVNRQLASKWVEGQQSVPQEIPVYGAENAANQLINQQVATSGTAAAREAAGIRGHGTLSYAVGIEPVQGLVDGHRMGNDYFTTNKRNIQDGMRHDMSVPPGTDQSTKGAVAALGKENARKAAEAAMYQAFWNGGQRA
jgi:hypothetical protein